MRLDSVADLLATIDALPDAARRAATARVEHALDLPAPAARMALGLLALDLLDEPAVAASDTVRPAEVIVLPDTLPVAASA